MLNRYLRQLPWQPPLAVPHPSCFDKLSMLRMRNCLLLSQLASKLTLIIVIAITAHTGSWAAGGGLLFPENLTPARWVTFKAAGYSTPVTGIIYRSEPRPVSGVPLGGVDTGCIDIESSGAFGYSSIFNHLTPRGGPINTPFLGVSVGGKTWVLTTGETKKYDTGREPLPLAAQMVLEGVEKAESIDYWGHYPIADLQFKTTAPVSAACRAWSPFFPGWAADSDTPGAVFEVHVANTSASRQTVTLAFSFPGFDSHKSGLDPQMFMPWAGYARVLPNVPEHKIVRKRLKNGPSGVYVSDVNCKMSYALGVIGDEKPRTGGELGTDGPKWARIARSLPGTDPETGGSSVAVDFTLEPGQEKTVRYVLAWFAPEWKGNGAPDTGGNTYTHMYAKFHKDAPAVAKLLAKEHGSMLKRIIAWQEEAFKTPEIPGWLADSLINNLHMITRTGIWAQAKSPVGDWCRPEDGIFALNEAPRSCSQLDTSPNSACGNIPLCYFFPECERSTLRACKAYQFEDGRPPWVFGGTTGDQGDGMDPSEFYEMVYPSRGYQAVMDGSNYMVRLDRYWKITGDDSFLKEFYDSAKRNTDWAFNMRPNYGLSQIVAMPTEGTDSTLAYDTEWFEDRPYYGYVSHGGGYRMAHARMMRRWAEKMGDTAHAKKMDDYLQAGARALQEHLWAGDHYMCFHEPETGRKHDALFTPGLDGQFFAYQHGVPGVFPQENVDKTLALVRKSCKISKLGIPPNYVSPDGTAWKTDIEGYLTGNYTYVQFTTYYTSMLFMYEGQKDFGLDLLRKCLDAYSCQQGYTWDGVNVNSGKTDDGVRSYGVDYYQNMGLWGVPAAVLGQDASGPAKPGGMVYRMIQAGKG
ncbi:MAG: hypothetical protein HYX78_07640 [Armatimonadetes bacterium]|nr:hypothetical protein [Armatimonadota bacterium]